MNMGDNALCFFTKLPTAKNWLEPMPILWPACWRSCAKSVCPAEGTQGTQQDDEPNNVVQVLSIDGVFFGTDRMALSVLVMIWCQSQPASPTTSTF